MIKICRLPTVVRKTGISKTSIYRQIGKSEFPAPFRLSPACVGWLEADVDGWIIARREGRRWTAGECGARQ